MITRSRMSKRHKQQHPQNTLREIEHVVTETECDLAPVILTGTEIAEPIEIPVPRVYAPPHCSACTAIRPKDTNYTRVYGMARYGSEVVRYCRCTYCGNTFKDRASR